MSVNVFYPLCRLDYFIKFVILYSKIEYGKHESKFLKYVMIIGKINRIKLGTPSKEIPRVEKKREKEIFVLSSVAGKFTKINIIFYESYIINLAIYTHSHFLQN